MVKESLTPDSDTPVEKAESAQPTASVSQNSSAPKPKSLIIGVVVAVILLLAGGVYAFGPFRDRTTNEESSDTGYTQTPQPAQQESEATATPAATDSLFAQQYANQPCTDQEVTFSSAPIPKADLGYIEPMGKVNDGHVTPTDHVYVHPKNSRAADNTYTAVMPADGTIVQIGAMPSQYIGDSNQQAASEDHRIVVMHSCRYYSIFIHVHKLDAALTKEVGKLAANENKMTSIALKAGDKIGGIGAQGFDWTLVDTKTKLAGFITPSLYEGESWKIHTIDPLSVYTGTLKTELEALSMRSAAPLGGKIDFDKAGALIGNWFREGTGGYSGTSSDNAGRYWDGHLSIVPDYVDPASTLVSIGNWQNDTAMQFSVKGTVDPSAVTSATGIVKYELIKLSYVTSSGANWTGNETFTKGIKINTNGSVVGTIMFQVMDGEKLKVEKFVGKTAAQVSGFTSAAQTYTR